MSLVELIHLSSAILTLAIGLVILSINRWRTINQAYAIAATLASVWLFGVYMVINGGLRNDRDIVVFWIRFANSAATFLPWIFTVIKIAIVDSCSLKHAIMRSWAWFLAGCFLTSVIYTSWFIKDGTEITQQRYAIVYALFIGSFSALCITVLVDAFAKIKDCTGVRLLELKFFVLNTCLCTLTILVSFTISSLLRLPQLRYIGPFVILISYGLTIWAICFHRVFDARQIFAALSRRLSSVTVLAACILTANHLLVRYLSDPIALIVSTCIGAAIATIWDKQVYLWLDLDPRRKLAGPRALFVEWAREEADAEKLTLKFEEFLRDWCQADYIKIYTIENQHPPAELLDSSNYITDFAILQDQGYITPETLARLRPNATNSAAKELLRKEDLGAVIAVPRGSHAPSCVVALGHKQSLRPYTYPDIQLLIALIEAIDNILAHSRVASHAARLETMETAAMMSRGLAHDLNNLTTPVSTFLLHMETRVQPGSLEAEVLNDAQHSIKVMQDYIRESLFFASRLKPDFRSYGTTRIVASVLKVTQQRAQSRGVLIVQGTIHDLQIQADEALICRLLQNLLFNAIDATPRGGCVFLSVTNVDKQQVCFQVSDQGPGIPPAIMEKLFEPYFTTKDTGNEIRGLGLGLAISHKISVLHSGEIKVSSSPVKGTVFTFTLPVNRNESTAVPAARGQGAPDNKTVPAVASSVVPA